MAYLGRLVTRSLPRSLVSRLLLSAAPVVLVVALLVVWVAAPLLRTPGDVAAARHDLLEVERYQDLLTMVDEQSLHWSEYQYLPSAELGAIRQEIEVSAAKIDELQSEWSDAPVTARLAFSAYDRMEKMAETSLTEVDAGNDAAALRVLTEQVLPATKELIEALQGVLLDRSGRLGETFAELAGNVKASFLGASLATRLRTVRYEIDQVLGVASLRDLVIREASKYAETIATGDLGRYEGVGLASVIDRDLLRLQNVVDGTEESAEKGALVSIARSHTEMTRAGYELRRLVGSDRSEQAAVLFEERLNPILIDDLLPRMTDHVTEDRKELIDEIGLVDDRARRLRAEIAASGGILLLVLMFPIALMGRSTVRPLRKIRDAADEVSSGNLSARTDVTDKSEVGQLAQAFDTMASRVEESRASLMSTAVLEASSDLLLIVRDGTVTYANGASTCLLGRPPGDVVGRPMADLVHPEDEAELATWTAARSHPLA